MRRHFCDACGDELRADGGDHFVVRMEARRAAADAPLTDADLLGQDDPDHVEAMHALLDGGDLPADGDPDFDPREYDFCPGCFAKFAADPLGRGRGRKKLSFSPN